MSESKFSKQNVVQAYQQMTQSSDPDLIKQADTYLNDFLETREAWLVSRDLIVNGGNSGLKFVGAHVLHEKIKSDYSKIPAEQRAELVSFVTQTLMESMKNQEKLIAEKLCRVYSSLALLELLYDNKSSILEQIIQRSSQVANETEAQLVLKLQHEIVRELDGIVLDLKKKAGIRDLLNQNIAKFATFWLNLLKSNLFVEDVLLCIEDWAMSRIELFKALELINYLVENCLKNLSFEHYRLLSKVLSTLMSRSSFGVNSDTTATLSVDIKRFVESRQLIEKMVQEKNLEALSNDLVLATHYGVGLIIEAICVTLKPVFETKISVKEDYFSTSFVSLLVSLTLEFTPYVFMTDTPVAKGLISSLLLATSHQDLSIAHHTLNVWLVIQKYISEQVKELNQNQKEFFLQAYSELIKIIFNQSRLKSWAEVEALSEKKKIGLRNVVDLDDSDGDINLDENLFKKVSLGEFRNRADDAIASVYCVLDALLKDSPADGKAQFFEFILQKLDQENNPEYKNSNLSAEQLQYVYLLNLEVVFVILAGVRLDIYETPDEFGKLCKTNSYILKVFEIAIKLSNVNQIYIVSKILQFFENFSVEFQKNTQLTESCIKVLMTLFDKFPTLTADIASVFHSMAVENKFPINITIYEYGKALRIWAQLIQSRLASIISMNVDFSQNRALLFSFVNLLSSTLDELDCNTPKGIQANGELMKTIITTDLPPALEYLSKYYLLKNCVRNFGLLFRELVANCPLTLFNYADLVLSTCMKILNQNPYKYCNLLRVCSDLMADNHEHPYITDYVSKNTEELLKFFLKCLENGEWNKTEFLGTFIDFWKSFLINFLDRAVQFNEFELIHNKLIVIYDSQNDYGDRKTFLQLVSACFEIQGFYQNQKSAQLIPLMVEVVVKNLKDLSSGSLNIFISKSLSKLVVPKVNKVAVSNSVNPLVVKQWIVKGLGHLKDDKFTDEKIEITSNAIISAKTYVSLKLFVYNLINYFAGYESDHIFVEMKASTPNFQGLGGMIR